MAAFTVLVSNSLGNVTSSNAVLRHRPWGACHNTVPLVSMNNTWRFHQSGPTWDPMDAARLQRWGNSVAKGAWRV